MPQSKPQLKDILHSGRLPLAEACRAIRALQGVSQDEFALRIGVNRKVVKDLEAGRGNPGRKSLERIAKAAGLRLALVPEQSVVEVLDPYARLAAEDARRDADARAIREGVPQDVLRKRNAMSLGGVRLRLAKIG